MSNLTIKPKENRKLDNPKKAAQVVNFMESTNASMRLAKFRESVGPNDFDKLLTDRMDGRLTSGWNTWDVPWRDLVNITEPSDMLDNYVYRVGALDKIDKLEDTGGTFQEFDVPDDTEIDYSVDGYGNILVADFKTLTSDRFGWFGKTSKNAGKAAMKRFYNWLFIQQLQANPTIFDSNLLFDSSNHNNDLDDGGAGVTLNYSNLTDAWNKMSGQTDNNGDPVFISAAYLIVGESNEIEAASLVDSPQNPDTSNNETNFFQNRLDTITVPWLGNDWYLWADNNTVETFETGFLDGNIDPSLYMLNPDVSDTYFKTKKQMWRVEHYYGGEWVDYRGVVRGSQDV